MIWRALWLAGLVLLAGYGCRNDAEQWQQDLLAARRGEPESVQGLVIRVRPDKKAYRADEPVILYFTLENVSTKDIPIYLELDTGVLIGLQIEGEGSFGKFSHVSPKIDLARTPENFAQLSHYVLLRPGYYVGRPIILPANYFKPGMYQVSVMYENRFPSCLAKPTFTSDEIRLLQEGALIESLWTGRVLSNLVDFEVVKAR